MVALHHAQERSGSDRDPVIEAARQDVDRRSAGLARALLATPPAVLRGVAARAAAAEAVEARWHDRVGEEPEFDADAAAAVAGAAVEVRTARAARDAVVFERHRILARGNGAGVAALGAAAGMVALGAPPMALPVAVTVVGAGIGPLAAGWVATRRTTAAARALADARHRWAAAVEATGASTMGEVAAGRLAHQAWERRQQEALAASEAARPQRRPWQLLAGPGVPPSDVDSLIARIDELRTAQLRLLGLLLERVAGSEPPASDVIVRDEEPAAAVAAGSWLDDAIDRIRRGGRLRLWGS